ncbi:hypothetical protein BDZ89DRAFT_1245386 [Hymenopellis radicata]|nr:hypothetical protein BDZ89DRAFT_1245386 [Hymenopellis radicata]
MANEIYREASFISRISPSTHRTEYLCIVGCGTAWMKKSAAIRHEDSDNHIGHIRRISRAADGGSSPIRVASSPSQIVDDDFDIVDDVTPASTSITVPGPATTSDDADFLYDDFDLPWFCQPTYDPDPEPVSSGQFSFADQYMDTTMDNLGSDTNSETSSEYSELPATPLPDVVVTAGEELDAIEMYTDEERDMTVGTVPVDGECWPWHNREEALLDVMTAFPRAVFSEPEMDITRWYAKQCGVEKELPTVRQVKLHRETLLRVAGANPTLQVGAFGNHFSTLDIREILAHEWANPLVRPHVHVYPEDSGERLSEPRQAAKWKDEVDSSFAAPMVRHNKHDYFVNEPALVAFGDDGCYGPVLPSRWFMRDGQIWAKVQRLRPHPSLPTLVIDLSCGQACEEIPLTSFMSSFPKFQKSHQFHGLPDPSRIEWIARAGDWEDSDSLEFEPCSVVAPNPMREKANGRMVMSVPLWVYCDDTSGNVSKKWNKHNSILFTLAGLSPKLVHLLTNIHFLATSNVAPPLEMFDAVVKMLVEVRENGGIEAYDCVLKEMVLLYPWILGMNGDNPMQSEFSSHIGMTGKCFCRVCHVVKTRPDANDDRGEKQRLKDFVNVSMFNSVIRLVFIIGTPRSKASTIEALESQLHEILRGAPTGADKIATATGVRDRYFQHFADILSQTCAAIKEAQKSDPSIQGTAHLIKVLKDLHATFPDDLWSPCLQFDPTSDSPVEILHVILLGFVKYFWRDAVSRQNAQNKEILKTRIDSVNVHGLGIDKPRGHTLVQYAGSLTGRDFRAVIQIAPQVLYKMIPDPAYEAWLALHRLCTLAFRPVINNKTQYLSDLATAVDDFLARTALWNTQWFNKPSFM